MTFPEGKTAAADGPSPGVLASEPATGSPEALGSSSEDGRPSLEDPL